MVRYCDFWEFKNEDDNFAQHVDVSMIQVPWGSSGGDSDAGM